MNNNNISRIFTSALLALLKSFFKIIAIGFAWTMKLLALMLSKIAEVIEKIIIKRSSL